MKKRWMVFYCWLRSIRVSADEKIVQRVLRHANLTSRKIATSRRLTGRYGSDEEVGGHGRLGEPECTKSAPDSVGAVVVSC
jgi:hypothetical protein